jgi:hypothetical protein
LLLPQVVLGVQPLVGEAVREVTAHRQGHLAVERLLSRIYFYLYQQITR